MTATNALAPRDTRIAIVRAYNLPRITTSQEKALLPAAAGSNLTSPVCDLLEVETMSDPRSGKFDEITSRLKEVVRGSGREIDTDAIMTRLRETVGQVADDVDTDALMARVKDVAGKTEGKIDTEKLRRWIDEVDRDKLKDWLNEARAMTASAATMVETRGERLAEKAPGAVDKWLGAAKEKIGEMTGDEKLVREGQLERLKGDIEQRYAGATDSAEGKGKNPPDDT